MKLCWRSVRADNADPAVAGAMRPSAIAAGSTRAWVGRSPGVRISPGTCWRSRRRRIQLGAQLLFLEIVRDRRWRP